MISWKHPLRRFALVALLVAVWAHAASATTITVDSTADDYDQGPNGNCTLREAVIAANTDTAVDACPAGSGADTIVVPAGTYQLSILGPNEDAAATGDLDILAPVTIQGAGQDVSVIDGLQSDHVFHVLATGGPVTFTDLTITNGLTAAIWNVGGDLTLLRSRVSSSRASAPFPDGGGILNQNGTLTLVDCLVDGNGSEEGGRGGGIASENGALSVTSSRFSGNFGSHAGGGVSIEGGTASFTGSTIGCDSDVDPWHAPCGNGTDWDTGGGIYAHGADVRIESSRISGNFASGGAGLAVDSGSLEVVDDIFQGNLATDFSPSCGWYSPCGFGAAVAALAAHATIDGSRFIDNSAGGGGALYAGPTLEGSATSDAAVEITNSQIVDCGMVDVYADRSSAVTILSSTLAATPAGRDPCSPQELLQVGLPKTASDARGAKLLGYERHDPLDAGVLCRIGRRKKPDGDLPILLGELHEEGLRVALFHHYAVDERGASGPVQVDIDHLEDRAFISQHRRLDASRGASEIGCFFDHDVGHEVGRSWGRNWDWFRDGVVGPSGRGRSRATRQRTHRRTVRAPRRAPAWPPGRRARERAWVSDPTGSARLRGGRT